MTTVLKKYKKPLLFVLALVPIAIVGGCFTGLYTWSELTDDVKRQILDQIGNNQSLYYLITTLQTLLYTLILGFFGYILSDKIGLMKPMRFEKNLFQVPCSAGCGNVSGQAVIRILDGIGAVRRRD